MGEDAIRSILCAPVLHRANVVIMCARVEPAGRPVSRGKACILILVSIVELIHIFAPVRITLLVLSDATQVRRSRFASSAELGPASNSNECVRSAAKIRFPHQIVSISTPYKVCSSDLLVTPHTSNRFRGHTLHRSHTECAIACRISSRKLQHAFSSAPTKAPESPSQHQRCW